MLASGACKRTYTMSKYRRPNADEGPTDMLGFPTPIGRLRDAAQGAPRALKIARRAQEAPGAEGSPEPWGELGFWEED